MFRFIEGLWLCGASIVGRFGMESSVALDHGMLGQAALLTEIPG
jgi:hypothetical protein